MKETIEGRLFINSDTDTADELSGTTGLSPAIMVGDTDLAEWLREWGRATPWKRLRLKRVKITVELVER